jgi:peroxin-1
VAVDLHRSLPVASTVHVSPLTPDDWEILVRSSRLGFIRVLCCRRMEGKQEVHAEYVERNLLSQVRAASEGQSICVWVGKSKTLVRFRVGV